MALQHPNIPTFKPSVHTAIITTLQTCMHSDGYVQHSNTSHIQTLQHSNLPTFRHSDIQWFAENWNIHVSGAYFGH